MPIVIGIAGKKRHGKNTVANILREQLNHIEGLQFHEFSFAYELKLEVAYALAPNSVTEREEHLNRMNHDDYKEFYRPILQWWGTEFRRSQDEAYWVKKIDQKIQACPKNSVAAITDVRFPDEARYVLDQDGFLYRVFRESVKHNDQHASEIALDNWIDWTDVVLNNGSLDDLSTEVHEVVTKPILKEAYDRGWIPNV